MKKETKRQKELKKLLLVKEVRICSGIVNLAT
jgi:hypothetical protein